VLYMVIEEFHDPAAVYRRLADRGRQLPDGLKYCGSWVKQDLAGCYQVMECDDRGTLDRWIGSWADLVSFEVVPVISSNEALNIFRQD